jgi:hypothetical protein
MKPGAFQALWVTTAFQLVQLCSPALDSGSGFCFAFSVLVGGGGSGLRAFLLLDAGAVTTRASISVRSWLWMEPVNALHRCEEGGRDGGTHVRQMELLSNNAKTMP